MTLIFVRPADTRTSKDPDFNPGNDKAYMIKKYWPHVAGFFLYMLLPLVIIYTRYRKGVTAYVCVMLGLQVLLLIAVMVVRRNRRKAQQTMPFMAWCKICDPKLYHRKEPPSMKTLSRALLLCAAIAAPIVPAPPATDPR